MYEVLETRPGPSLTLTDLGTGERVEVREPSVGEAARVGQFIGGRAVPAGGGKMHQLVGEIFAVTPATEAEVLELSAEGAGHELLNYVARQRSPL